MTFRGGIEKTENRASSGGNGGRIVVGGGLGTVVIVGLFLLLGGSPTEIGAILGGSNAEATQRTNQSSNLEHCKTSDDANKYPECRVEFTAISLDKVWGVQLPEQAGITYTKPEVTIFESSVNTGCGQASAATGPFYCPADQTVYLDVSFFQQLTQFGGEDTPFAQEYIVAHEFGHHIQQLEGTLGLSNYNDPGADSNAVKIELQADCYAGVWAHYADKGSDALLEPLTRAQVQNAITTARAVGDDNIQRRSGGSVNPDQFTHGTSEQREEMFLSGYESGKMASCDLLGRGVYQQ